MIGNMEGPKWALPRYQVMGPKGSNLQDLVSLPTLFAEVVEDSGKKSRSQEADIRYF